MTTRRAFLTAAAASAAGYALAGGLRPTRGEAAIANLDTTDIARGYTLLDAPYTVEAGRTLRFDPNADTTVETRANVIVKGTLEMKPNPGVMHTLRFIDVSESAFVGGGMRPLASDVGLWVTGAGKLDLRGTHKVGWNRTGNDQTWSDHDELVVAPVAVGQFGSDGSFATFAKGSPVPRARADVPAAEVLNLTRNVRIEGTPGGRSHVFIRNAVQTVHTIRDVALRHLGPRKDNRKVLGRYPLHFHMCGASVRGTMVESTVVRDAGSHAFVSHASHGITFRDCIAYAVQESAYWWDGELVADRSSDILWDRCFAGPVIAGEKPDETFGFVLRGGARNTARGCVAVGVWSAGFNWPEKVKLLPRDGWTFEDNVAHNNQNKGAYFWENVDAGPPQTLKRFTVYRNQFVGVIAGAYIFNLGCDGVLTAENGSTSESYGFGHGEVTRNRTGNRFRGLTLKNERVGLRFVPRGAIRQVGTPEIFEDLRIEATDVPIQMSLAGVRRYDFVRPMVDGRDLLPSDITFRSYGRRGSVLRVQRLDGKSAWRMDLHDGSVSEIRTFA